MYIQYRLPGFEKVLALKKKIDLLYKGVERANKNGKYYTVSLKCIKVLVTSKRRSASSQKKTNKTSESVSLSLSLDNGERRGLAFPPIFIRFRPIVRVNNDLCSSMYLHPYIPPHMVTTSQSAPICLVVLPFIFIIYKDKKQNNVGWLKLENVCRWPFFLVLHWQTKSTRRKLRWSQNTKKPERERTWVLTPVITPARPPPHRERSQRGG